MKNSRFTYRIDKRILRNRAINFVGDLQCSVANSMIIFNLKICTHLGSVHIDPLTEAAHLVRSCLPLNSHIKCVFCSYEKVG